MGGLTSDHSRKAPTSKLGQLDLDVINVNLGNSAGASSKDLGQHFVQMMKSQKKWRWSDDAKELHSTFDQTAHKTCSLLCVIWDVSIHYICHFSWHRCSLDNPLHSNVSQPNFDLQGAISQGTEIFFID